jgi:hypothetical protein
MVEHRERQKKAEGKSRLLQPVLIKVSDENVMKVKIIIVLSYNNMINTMGFWGFGDR